MNTLPKITLYANSGNTNNSIKKGNAARVYLSTADRQLLHEVLLYPEVVVRKEAISLYAKIFPDKAKELGIGNAGTGTGTSDTSKHLITDTEAQADLWQIPEYGFAQQVTQFGMTIPEALNHIAEGENMTVEELETRCKVSKYSAYLFSGNPIKANNAGFDL